jgi:creatinine amidohydrolase
MKLTDLKWPEVDSLSKDLPVVIPIAAHEQHGNHMPLHTDSLLLGEIIRRAEEALGDDALFAPLQWLGNSHHHMDFPGTLSAEPRVYLDVLNGLLENFLHHGFKRLVLLNGHGGNMVPGAQAVFEVRQRHRDRTDLLLLSATYWDQVKVPEIRDDLVQDAMGHAGELETSMMLVIRPELVGELKRDEVPKGESFANATRGWTTKDRSTPGHIGVPAAANPEKGEALFQAFTAGAVKLVREMQNWDGQSWDA